MQCQLFCKLLPRERKQSQWQKGDFRVMITLINSEKSFNFCQSLGSWTLLKKNTFFSGIGLVWLAQRIVRFWPDLYQRVASNNPLSLPFGPVPTELTIGGYKQDHSIPALRRVYSVEATLGLVTRCVLRYETGGEPSRWVAYSSLWRKRAAGR